MTNSNYNPDDQRNEALGSVPDDEKAGLQHVWDLVSHADESPTISKEKIEQTWQNLSAFAQANTDTPVPNAPKLRLITIRRTWLAAAAAVLFAAIGYGWWLQPLTFHAPEGQQVLLTLHDGSSVLLNSGSTLKYPRSFGETRDVTLEGEAYFDVTHSEASFQVNTFNATVQVLGTSFNVRSWEQSLSPSTSVTLDEGSVRFAPKSTSGMNTPGVIMQPGQTRTLSGAGPEISPADTLFQQDATAWKSGDLVFRDIWLGLVIEDIERKFAMEILLEENDILKKEVTFVLRQPDTADEVLESLCDAIGLKYSRTSRGVTLYRDNNSSAQ